MPTIPPALSKLMTEQPQQLVLLVSIAAQVIYLLRDQDCLQQWPVSTASRGAGNRQGSLQTPTGLHAIAEKIGSQAPAGSIFRARVNTGEQAEIINEAVAGPNDLITSRILWLKGLEPGQNQGGEVDSQQRYIYIHGTAEEGLIGTPASHGCIRMRNQDIIKLFEQVDCETPVYIAE